MGSISFAILGGSSLKAIPYQIEKFPCGATHCLQFCLWNRGPWILLLLNQPYTIQRPLKEKCHIGVDTWEVKWLLEWSHR